MCWSSLFRYETRRSRNVFRNYVSLHYKETLNCLRTKERYEYYLRATQTVDILKEKVQELETVT